MAYRGGTGVRFDLSQAIDAYNRTARGPGEAPMTQRRLAELVGTTEAMVSRHATGRVSPGSESLIATLGWFVAGSKSCFLTRRLCRRWHKLTVPPSAASYVEIDGDLYPADRVGPGGRPLPITEEQAAAIQTILMEECQSKPCVSGGCHARARLPSARATVCAPGP